MARKLDKTIGVVLTSLPLTDHHGLVHIYTRDYGRITCSFAPKLRLLLSPMSVVEVELTSSGRRNATGELIYSLREVATVLSAYTLTQANPELALHFMFMAELTERTVRETEPNPSLWQFISAGPYPLLTFVIGLSSQLGFSIDTSDYTPGCQFDMQEGEFTTCQILHPYYLLPDSTSWLYRVLSADTLPQMSDQERNTMLQILITFLEIHIPEMGHLKTLDALISY